MIVEIGQKVHVIYRALYENSVRRHFVGEVAACDKALCRLEGYVFINDKDASTYLRRPEKRITIIDLAESGYIVNFIDQAVNIEKVSYRYISGVGLSATDGENFSLNINEYGSKS